MRTLRQLYEKVGRVNTIARCRDRIDHTDRIHPERPAGTVIVGSKAGGGRPHIHPDFPRHITVREALQRGSRE